MATMVHRHDRILPAIGAIVLVLALAALLLLPAAWALVVLGILAGGLINIPVKRYPRDDLQPVVRGAIFNLGLIYPEARLAHSETVLAVNLGGGIIASLVAAYQLSFILGADGRALIALAIAAAVNIAICYRLATPVRGVGMALPAFIPPLAPVLIAWVLLSGTDPQALRAPVVFIASVAGSLIGANLLHLSKFKNLPTGMASIGGAGTFDGIIFASVVAAFFA